jgi:hypothetical protein
VVELGDLLRNVGTPTLGGLLGLCILLILGGRLVPVSTLRRELEAEHQRAEDFKAAHQAADQRADKLLEQQDQLLAYARTADAALTALRAAAERRRN